MFLSKMVSGHIDAILAHALSHYGYIFDAAVVCTAVWILLRWHSTSRSSLRTTQLPGPPGDSFLYGVGKRTLETANSGSVYEAWAKGFGSAYSAPSTLGRQRIVLCDPKAVAHFYSKDAWTYIQTPLTKKALADFPGKGLFRAHGESHKRQRKSLTPAFSIAAIRQLTSIFYDSAYKAKTAWDTLIESSGEDSAVIDVQTWMNHISLDTVGLAGFSHDFGALEGKHAPVTEILDTFGASSSTLHKGLFLLAEVFPFLMSLPTPRMKLVQKLNMVMGEILDVLLTRTQQELEMGVIGGQEEKSIIGLLIKGERDESESHLTNEEVMAQMKAILLAGYETTSICLTWALLELSRHPEVQTKLRNELLDHGVDPTYDQLTDGFPYLDAVVHEVLRVHSPIIEMTRVAIEDDVIPLSDPVRAKSGALVDSLTIAKGTHITIPIESLNRSATIWGEDAKHFRPDRWLVDADGLDGIPAKAKEIQGHRHVLTFIDGPRMCLGKNFALTELKAVLNVLVKNFTFEMRDGVDSKIEMVMGVLHRPKLAGEVECRLPLCVRPYIS